MSVIDGGFGIPLGDLVGGSGCKRRTRVSTAGEKMGQLYVKGCGDGRLAAGREGAGQDDADDIDVLWVIFQPGFLAVDAEFEAVHVTAVLLVGKIEVGAAVVQELFAEGGAVVLIGVWPAMEPNIVKCVGGVVDVPDAGGAVERMCGVAQGNVDGIMHFLLEVVVLGESREPEETHDKQ